jgi:hypothetical protein
MEDREVVVDVIKAWYAINGATGKPESLANSILEALGRQEMMCKCVYESDCHGMEMIKAPSGREMAIGGTKYIDRYRFCPYCGGKIPNPLPSPEKPFEILRCSNCGQRWNDHDPKKCHQPEKPQQEWCTDETHYRGGSDKGPFNCMDCGKLIQPSAEKIQEIENLGEFPDDAYISHKIMMNKINELVRDRNKRV